MKRIAAIALSCLLISAAPLSFAEDKVTHKVVIQVSDNDPAKWNLALNNARNIQDALGKDQTRIEVVAYGPGIDMLKLDSTVGNRLQEATEAGVTITACANTMKSRKLTPADMHPAARIVPAGVVEIIKREGEGYAYIRP